MWQQEFTWFFTIFHQELRKNDPIAFEVLMVLALAHLFGFYNPKQLSDLLGIVFTMHQMALPLHLLFCPKQGRHHTNKADWLIFMFTQLKADFHREGIAITQFPLTLDPGFVSEELKKRLQLYLSA